MFLNIKFKFKFTFYNRKVDDFLVVLQSNLCVGTILLSCKLIQHPLLFWNLLYSTKWKKSLQLQINFLAPAKAQMGTLRKKKRIWVSVVFVFEKSWDYVLIFGGNSPTFDLVQVMRSRAHH
ncbi:hypothetical protein HS088_TW03G01330 [Tripterygium wilfordii]|uniref:Uncharacterized protein n=1 Tax=Tripterygium wilfordii TaxID=458696 RepID=A0A7J7DXJ0_TRIWF|nr:hypothetical protein HS088_TW03G01330 [Tripterygium wilfordii]